MNVALTAYREDQVRKLLGRIHTQYKDLMAKRPEEVKALFLKSLKDFAMRPEEVGVEGALTPQELSEHEDEAIRVAISRFNEEATKLFGEYEILKGQLSEARATVRALEEELRRRSSKVIKKGYRQKQLEQQVRTQQERITQLQRALKEMGERARAGRNKGSTN